MNLINLKQKIINKEIPSSISFIFQCEGDYFIADEYICKIAELSNKDIIYVDRLPDLFLPDSHLYVIKTDKLESDLLTSNKNVNYIICCKKTNLVSDNIITFPKLQDWQLVDYVKSFNLDISDGIIDRLVRCCKNPYRLKSEVIKIKCFSRADHESTCENILDTSPDLFTTDIFNVVNGLLKKNIGRVSSFYNTDADVTGMYLLTIILKNLRNIIEIQLNPRATADSLGIPYKQFKAIQYNCGHFDNNNLVNLYQHLLTLDKKVKEGYLEEKQLVDYIIVNVIGRWN